MFFRTLSVACDFDNCHAETFQTGRDANTHTLTDTARGEGWAISSAGHYCPQHRSRPTK
jgi:hypothetical protein